MQKNRTPILFSFGLLVVGGILLFISPICIYLSSYNVVHGLKDFCHELGMALWVAIPIIWSVELYNHSKSEEELVKHALGTIKRGLPKTVWSTVERHILQADFFKSDTHYILTITQQVDPVRGAYYAVTTYNEFLINARTPERGLKWTYTPSVIRDGKFGDLNALTRVEIGADQHSQDDLAARMTPGDGIDSYAFDPVKIDPAGVKVTTSGLIAMAEDSPYWVFSTIALCADFKVTVHAKGLKVDVDALHPDIDGFEHVGGTWKARSGMLPMNGCVVRWTKALPVAVPGSGPAPTSTPAPAPAPGPLPG